MNEKFNCERIQNKWQSIITQQGEEWMEYQSETGKRITGTEQALSRFST
jgi:hypothetical protein